MTPRLLSPMKYRNCSDTNAKLILNLIQTSLLFLSNNFKRRHLLFACPLYVSIFTQILEKYKKTQELNQHRPR